MKSLNEYQQQAMSTAIFPVDRSLDYTVLGLLSEVGEMAEAWVDNSKSYPEVASEVGDCYWYVAAIADTLDVRLELVVKHYAGSEVTPKLVANLIPELMASSGNLAGLVKKAIRDDGGHFSSERQAKAEQYLGRTILILDALAVQLGSSRYALMNANLDKLADRKARGVLKGSGDHR